MHSANSPHAGNPALLIPSFLFLLRLPYPSSSSNKRKLCSTPNIHTQKKLCDCSFLGWYKSHFAIWTQAKTVWRKASMDTPKHILNRLLMLLSRKRSRKPFNVVVWHYWDFFGMKCGAPHSLGFKLKTVDWCQTKGGLACQKAKLGLKNTALKEQTYTVVFLWLRKTFRNGHCGSVHIDQGNQGEKKITEQSAGWSECRLSFKDLCFVFVSVWMGQ